MMRRVLIIEDNDAVRTALQVLFDIHDIPCIGVSSPAEGENLVRSERIAAVIQDMNFTEDSTSGEEGVRLFRRLRSLDPFLPILLVTAWTSLETAVQLVKEGAYDYIGKPWDDAKLVEAVKCLLRTGAGPAETSDAPVDRELCGLVYEDPAMHRLVATALRIAKSEVPVLVTGPNGSGKELLAQIIQANSRRHRGPFVKVNAGALPQDLLESELFGVEPGAFTGAQKRRIGRFEEAHGGTLFLDEIGNLPLQGQVKLLRVLQSGEFSRLGSNRVMAADVRIISATNTDLSAALATGTFREDLYFRLNVVELAVPPLADRPKDVLPLARHFLATLAGSEPKNLGPAAESALLGYHWPGNVRELRNLMQRAMLISATPTIEPEDLGLAEREPLSEPTGEGEKDFVARALDRAGGNVSQAATALGISRQALYRRMEKHGIVWERRPQR